MNLRLTDRSLSGVVKILQLACRMLRCLKNDWFWPAGTSEGTVWGLTHPLKKASGRGRPHSGGKVMWSADESSALQGDQWSPLHESGRGRPGSGL